MDCAEGPRAPLVATITSPDETPTVVIAHTAPIGRISDCLDASEARWQNRQPWQTFVLRHDGTVESYYTPGSCENRNNDHATAHLDVQSVIYPRQPADPAHRHREAPRPADDRRSRFRQHDRRERVARFGKRKTQPATDELKRLPRQMAADDGNRSLDRHR